MRVPTSVSPYSAFDIFYFSVFRPNENYKRYRGQYNYRDKFEPTNKFQRRVASLREKKKEKKITIESRGMKNWRRWLSPMKCFEKPNQLYRAVLHICILYTYIYIYFLVRFSPALLSKPYENVMEIRNEKGWGWTTAWGKYTKIGKELWTICSLDGSRRYETIHFKLVP